MSVSFTRSVSSSQVSNWFSSSSTINIPSRDIELIPVTNGLQIYLDAQNTSSYPGTGTTWFDLSGNNRNFTWNTTPSFTTASGISYFSTNGRKAAGPASNSVGINNTSGYTVILIMMQNTLQNSSAFKFYRNNLSGSDGRGIFSHCTWSDNSIYFDQGGCCASSQRTAIASGGSQTWNMFTFRRVANSSTRTISKNESVLITNTNAANNIDLDGRAIDVGGSDEGTTWDARLGIFLVYNRDISDAEMSLIFNRFRSRYGI